MKPLTRQAARLVWMLAVLAGCSSLVQPDTDRLAPWTTELRAKQPADAFGSVYARGRNKLVFVGAAHTEATDSLTFKMIDQAYATFDIDAVIVEGSRRSRSPNYEKLLQWAASQPQHEGRQEGGETIPAVRGAVAQVRKRSCGVSSGCPIPAHCAKPCSAHRPARHSGRTYSSRSCTTWSRHERCRP